jgi:hypothetical protein
MRKGASCQLPVVSGWGLISTAIESKTNLHKSPMLRQLLEQVKTPYALLMDYDSHVKPGCIDALDKFIGRENSFGLAGSIARFHRSTRRTGPLKRNPTRG